MKYIKLYENFINENKVFTSTIHRIPTITELEKFNETNLTPEEIFKEITYTIIGRGMRTFNTISDVLSTCKLLNDISDARYPKVLEIAQEYANKYGFISLYHGTDDKYENLKTDQRLSGLYTSTDIKAAEIYGNYIWEIQPKENIKIKDLSDPFEMLQTLSQIIGYDEIDEDLEGYVLSGKLFQYDISSRTHYVDYIVDDAAGEGYDLIKIPDDLHGYGDNIAYIIINIDKFNCKLI